MTGRIVNFLLLLAVFSSFLNCHQENQKKIAEDTFVKIYCDVVTCSDLVEANKKQVLIDSIMQQYHVSYADFLHNLSLLEGNNDKWPAIYDKIVKELETRKQELDENKLQKTESEPQKMKRLTQ